MALNIKNTSVERLAAEVAELAHETKTEAIRRALEERKERLELHVASRSRSRRAWAFLEREVWPLVPPEQSGKALTKDEKEEILGYGPDGPFKSLTGAE
jgi:antitoxin VapB